MLLTGVVAVASTVWFCLVSGLMLKKPLRVGHLLWHFSESLLQLRHDLDNLALLVGRPAVSCRSNGCVVLLPQLNKPSDFSPALRAMTRLRLNPEEVILEPRLLLFGCPRELMSTPLAFEVRVYVPVTGTYAVVLLLNVPPYRCFVMNRQGSKKQVLRHLLGMFISEDVHVVTSGQNAKLTDDEERTNDA
jgi:hypothetical protein